STADGTRDAAAIAPPRGGGKLHNSRHGLMRSARETGDESERERFQRCAEEISTLLRRLEHPLTNNNEGANGDEPELDRIRGYEGQAANLYFNVFDLHLRQQRADFAFGKRSARPPLDLINCLLSFIYALLRHDCIAALTATGLDPFVGYLHAERPNRPALALDLMEEFRPWLAERLAITLINRRQITLDDFVRREGGAVEFTN